MPTKSKNTLKLPKDFGEIVRILNSHGVKYLVVGGYAVSIYSEPRATKDIDIWVETSAENSRAVYNALKEFGAPLKGLSADDFYTSAQTGFQIGVSPHRIDVLHSIDGVTFKDAWQNRVQATIRGEVAAMFISREDLLKNKTQSGRVRDVEDIKAIRAATARPRRSKK